MGFAQRTEKAAEMLAYLAAMLMAAIVTDFLAARFKPADADFKIKFLPKELKFLFAVQIVVIVISLVRFQVFTDWQHTGFVFKLPILILMILFVFPVVLLFVYLKKWRYSPKDLGFRLRGVWLGLPVILIIGAAAYFFKPEKILFGAVYEEMGLLSMILTGFLVAAIPEELTRVLIQTRVGKVLRDNAAAGWLIASIIWAFLHLPNFWAQSGDFISALWSVLAILPIGLLWGYMTHRTRSIMPAVSVHGTNLWGLQNF